MKNINNYFILFIILIFPKLGSTQIFQSSCEAHDSIVGNYLEDASYITYEDIYQNNNEWIDSIELPISVREKFLDAIIAVYNVDDLDVVEEIFKQNDIHTFPRNKLNEVLLSVDSTTTWYGELRKGNIPTGYTPIDTLLSVYALNVSNIYDWSNQLGFHGILFKSEEYYNIDLLTALFSDLDGVIFSEINWSGGDGNHIEGSFINDNVSLIFSHGWGDCLSGCTNRQYWEFLVYPDCSVEYLGTYGDIGTSISNLEIEYSISPNPFTDEINVSESLNGYNFSIFNMKGNVIRVGKINNASISELDNLPNQSYILKLFKGNETITKILIKN